MRTGSISVKGVAMDPREQVLVVLPPSAGIDGMDRRARDALMGTCIAPRATLEVHEREVS